MIDDKPKVLIVDDERLNLNLLNELLKSEYDVSVATTGEQALKGVAACKPDIILLDIMMPDINGYEVCRILKEDVATQDIPIIFITAKNYAIEETLGFELGAVDFISKPFNNSVVKARLRTHMRLKKKTDLLERLVALDGLTEIPNRRAFDETREREWARCYRLKSPISMLMLDVDLFKQYNDSYGHSAGDDCLIKVAKALSSCVRRPGDFVARYGGEEFAAILADTDYEGAMRMGEVFRETIESLDIAHDKSNIAKHITASVGVATVLPHGDATPDMLADAADKMLYMAKEAGRNRVSGGQI